MARKQSSGSNTNHFHHLTVTAKNSQQENYLQSMQNNIITIVNGFAGSGKTFMATLYAVKEFLDRKYDKIIFSRPCVEAGEKIGFLPGTLEDKLSPYLTPILDVLEESIGNEAVEKLTKSRQIRTMPIGYMRGITFKNAFVLLDEAQNVTVDQMRLFLTRIGVGTKIVVTGDSRQSDIRERNGFVDIIERMVGIEGINIIELDQSCIVRHPLVAKIEERYMLKTKKS